MRRHVEGNFSLAVARGHFRECPLFFVAVLSFRALLTFIAILIRDGMVTYAAPRKSPEDLSSVMYRVTCASGSNPVV